MAAEQQSSEPEGQSFEEGMQFLRRAPILLACRDEPLSRRELADETGASRTTVYRATDELEEEGLVEQTDGSYRTTSKGEALSAAVERYQTGLEAVERLDVLFEYEDHPELVSNAHLLADAELTVADDDNIYRANDRSIELWDQSDTVRAGMVGSGSRHCLEALARCTIEGDVDAEMCFRSDVAPTGEFLDTTEFDFDDLFESLDAYVTDSVPFTFLLYDEVAAVVGHDHVGVPAVFAETDSPRVYQWLEGLYEDCKPDTSPVSAEDL